MGIDKKGVRFCDECGRSIVKAHKIYGSNEYCGSCYPRVFPSVPCSCCGKSARPHRHDVNPAVCSKCLIAQRKCLRCEKPVPRAGLLIDGEPVCPSCVHYFRDPCICPSCNQTSSRLSSMPSLGIVDKICESCRNGLTHATCSVCRKYRKIVQGSDVEGAKCSSCVDDPSITHACPDCGKVLPGHGNSRCRSCANKIALNRELVLTGAIFNRDWVATLWHRFGAWLHVQKGGAPNLLAVLRSHQTFFERLDVTFASVLDITDSSLLRLFGTATLRSHLLPTRFLAEQLEVRVSPDAKLKAAERGRIDEIRLNVKREPWGGLIEDYLRDLDSSGLSLRSIRMYISTAHMFASNIGLTKSAWMPGEIERFVARHPGTRNNLSRFVSFCRKSRSWDVAMPPKGEALSPIKDPVKVASKLANLIQKVEAIGLPHVGRSLLTRILATALGLPVRAVADLSFETLKIADSGISIQYRHETIILPSELHCYAQRLHQYFVDDQAA